MKASLSGLITIACFIATTASSIAENARAYQKLHIPEVLGGKTFQLNLHKDSKSFWQGATTATYAFNGEKFWGPTLFFNQGDTVQLNVKNSLDEVTTPTAVDPKVRSKVTLP